MNKEKFIFGLTPPQVHALGRVCRSNGAGVQIPVGTSDHNYGTPTTHPWRKLWELDLIQGKANHAYRVVHTRKGLELWRALEVQPNG